MPYDLIKKEKISVILQGRLSYLFMLSYGFSAATVPPTPYSRYYTEKHIRSCRAGVLGHALFFPEILFMNHVKSLIRFFFFFAITTNRMQL